MRPSGADNYLKWRRSIDEHLELRRLSWDEYGMFNWLCTKASPRTGTVRTSWPVLAEQTGLSRSHVEKLCRRLKRKRYIWYPLHRGKRGSLVEVAIHKFPLAGNTYTDLSARFGEVPAQVPTLVPTQLGAESSGNPNTSGAGRKRKRSTTSLRVRGADPHRAPERLLTKAEAISQAPAVLRETLELFFLKTGRDRLAPQELDALRLLETAHTPAVIQKAVTTAVERFGRRGQAPAEVPLGYIWESLKQFSTRKTPHAGQTRHGRLGPGATVASVPPRKYPPGLSRMRLREETNGRDPIPEGAHDPQARSARGEVPGPLRQGARTRGAGPAESRGATPEGAGHRADAHGEPARRAEAGQGRDRVTPAQGTTPMADGGGR
ncbi:MAG: hypothetical protein HY726_20645 [Candidatus Rokubacteria bacterium]|nr:hypothetical protein [Candidatus Rokubacteria bacterium]